MREIGSLPKSLDPRIFGDYLLSIGVKSRAVESRQGWAVWVLDEDQLGKASEALRDFLEDPAAPRFTDATKAADTLRRVEEIKDREYRKNLRKVAPPGVGWNLRRRPLTALLMGTCIAIYLGGELNRSAEFHAWDTLGFFPFEALRDRANLNGGLDAIRRGELWRLITPMLLHVNLIHLIFNMWATTIESTAIEYTRGTMKLFVLVLVSAVVSNVGQYLYEVNFEGLLTPWGGFSGVLYALFGYLWMKSRFEPSHGMMIPPGAVRTMLLWLLLGFTGIMPMANGAHVAGLVVGMMFGLAGF